MLVEQAGAVAPVLHSARGDAPDRARQKSDSVVLACVSALFCLPMAMPHHGLPSTTFYSSVLACLLALGILLPGALSRIRSGNIQLSVSPLGVCAFAFAALIVLQHLLGLLPYVQHLVLSVGVLILFGCLVSASATRFAREPETVSVAIAWALVAGGVVQAAWCGVQVAGFELIGWELVRQPGGISRAGGLFMQSNNLAMYLVWSLGALHFLHGSGRLGRIATLALAGVFLIALSFAGSRSTYVYLFVLGPVAAFLQYRQRNRPAQWWWPLVVPLLYLVIDLLNRSVLVGLLPGMTSMRSLEVASLDIRGALISDAWQVFLAHPLVGAGLGNFAGARFGLAAPTPVQLNNDHAHNLVSDLSAEFGLAGIVIFVVAAVLWWRSSRNGGTSVRTFLLVSLGAVGLYSFVEFPLWLPMFLLTTAVLAGASSTQIIALRISPGLSRLLGGATVLLLVLAVFVTADYARMERAYENFFAPRNGRPLRSVDLLALSSHTLFRLEGEELYARASINDPFVLEFDAEITARVFASNPAPEFAFARANHLVLLGRSSEAATVVRRTCAADAGACGAMRDDFQAFAETRRGPYVDFVQMAFPQANSSKP